MTVNYGGGGSGKGRTDLAGGTVQFAGSDSPIPAKEASNFQGKTVLYYPILIAPITVSYNLSGLSKPLQLSGPVTANIFSGKIKTWNDPAIKADNPGVTLPSTSITVASIGEAAADAIGANGLLVRVGAYFHDVGKMLKPHYFVENASEGENRHDHLAPGTGSRRDLYGPVGDPFA